MTTKPNACRRGAGIKALIRGALVVCSFIFAAVAGARQPSAGSAAGLDGRWYHDGKPTRILVAPDGRSITIVNEVGQSSDGYANGPHNIVIPSLGITGEVNKKGRRISWTNGTEWTREQKNPGPDSGVNVNGRWFRNGQPTRIDVAADGRNFSITNEWGLPGAGYIDRSGELKVPSWRVTGHLSNNGQRISWSNGTEWTRPRLY
jgi:hypothetical protein